MPIGKYANFAACVTAMKKEGKSEDSARRICGKMEQQAKEELKKDEDGHIIVAENVPLIFNSCILVESMSEVEEDE